MPKTLTESVALLEATTVDKTDTGLLLIEFITPGWGSSGYYSPKVVEAAAPLFAVGTHMYFDHPTDTEDRERPGRSVLDLGAVIEQAGAVDKTTGGIRGLVRPLAPYRDLLTDEAFAKNIGVSIRASASDITLGEAEGRRGPIVEGLVNLQSVDFVTRAGRGGSILQVLESARHADVHEATASDRHQHLQRAVRTAYDGPGKWVYVRDHDADKRVVWFDISAEGPTETFEQTYDVAANDVDITLTGESVRVSSLTTYVPVSPGSTTNPPTQESKEDLMEISESEHTALTEKANKVAAAEQRAIEAEQKLAERDRRDQATALIAEKATEGKVEFTILEQRGLLADLPVKDDTLDVDAFTKTVEAAVTDKTPTVTESGTGTRVTGFGASATTDKDAVESARPTTSPWGRPLTEQKGA